MLKSIRSLALFAAILSAGMPVFAADIQDPIIAGTKATFIAEADGTAPMLFEWYRNDTKIGEGTPFIIDLTGPELSGTYYVRVSNEFSRAKGIAPVASADRYVITVGVPPSAPRIKRVLSNQTVKRGSDVKLEIEAEGTPPLLYSWQHGNSIVKGETRSYVMLPSIKNKDGGYWKATARNQFGGATSDMVLSVR